VVARIEATADGGSGPGTGLVNPVQAVTAVLPAPGPASPPAAQPRGVIPIDRAPRPDRTAAAIALPLAATAGAVALLLVAAAFIVPAGCRRHWRPGPTRL
jgi:membrane-anchored mycosin MYCP